MLRRFSINFTIFSMLLDGVIVFFSMQIMTVLRLWMNRLSFIATLPAHVVYPVWLFSVFPLLWVLVLATFSIYDGKKIFRVTDELSTLTAASFIASISQAGILYLTYRDFSRALFLLIVICSYLLCVIWRLIFRLIFRMRKDTLSIQKNILIVGMGLEISRVEKTMLRNHSSLNETLIKLDLRSQEDLKNETPETCPLTLKKIRMLVDEDNITDVVLAFSRNSSDWIAVLTSNLEDLPLGVWVALDYYDLSLSDTYVENLAGVPLLDLRAPALNEYSRVLKRIFDLIVASITLVLVSPLMVLSAILVLIDDGWPVFFLQKRIGENGQPFTMIKFRTMVRNAEKMSSTVALVDENGEAVHKSRSDPRVTGSGRFLRRLSLDELPQFINVLKGDMSIVGPRPELPYLVENYEHWQRRRLSVPPGITGWWQVNGRSDHMMHLHTEDDIYYVENYSIWLDIRIMIRTIWVVIIGRGAF
jgi:exopolysaccharide biosynthesis polyprenyl glycosylphosphotransferase